jgi:hypothetical protein
MARGPFLANSRKCLKSMIPREFDLPRSICSGFMLEKTTISRRARVIATLRWRCPPSVLSDEICAVMRPVTSAPTAQEKIITSRSSPCTFSRFLTKTGSGSPVLSQNRSRDGSAWFACRRAGRPFTTCYHTRFPEYLAARRVAPSRFVYALLRRSHNAGSGMMVSTETLGRELDTRGFVRLMRWSRGVDCNLFRPRAARIFEFPRPIFLTCSRVAVEKNLDAFLSRIYRVQRSSLGTVRRGGSFRRAFPERISSAKCATRGLPPPTRVPTYSCSQV